MNDSWPRESQGRELENLTQLFKVLGDPSRMKVLTQILYLNSKRVITQKKS